MTTDDTEQLAYTPAQVLRLLPIGRGKLYADLKTGLIPSRRIGTAILIPREWVDAFARAVPSAAAPPAE